MTISDIKNQFIEKYNNNDFVDVNGTKTIEIINANFEVDKNETTIFGELNEYADRELEWYKSMSLNVNDIPGKVPAIWKAVADNDGLINSNYGWCILSPDNYSQYKNCLKHLINNPNTRQACMIYTRPSMQYDYNANGMSDFMCTFAVQVFIRNGILIYNVLMRSNDAVYGFKNDLYWHRYVINCLLWRGYLMNYADFVLKDGKVIVENGMLISELEDFETPSMRGSVNVKWIEESDFRIEAKSDEIRTIEVIPHQLVTKSIISKAKIENGNLVSNIEEDTLKICVIERHRATGNIGKGFVKGFNLKSGAIASTVAHDSHNMIIVGTNDYDMYVAAVELVKSQGGKIVVNNGEVISKLPLPIAGLMSDKDFNYVLEKCDELNKASHKIGCTLEDPFMTMAFMSLPVIPELKVTDKGIFDTNKFKFVDIFDRAEISNYS